MLEVAPDSPVRQATLEVERHVAAGGWDQPPRLFALVRTGELIAARPSLADQLGSPDSFTPIEQEDLDPRRSIEELLPTIMWPETVHGCAVAMERVMLPPEAQESLPEDPAELARVAAEHPQRQEVRIVAAVLRDGAAHSTVRARLRDAASDAEATLLEGPELVPALTRMLAASMH